jgi:hypothetical protein
MVRAGRTRNCEQWCTGSGRLEMRNTLRPGGNVFMWRITRELSSARNVESWGRWLGNEIDRSEGVPPRPYIFDCGALHADMITVCA